MALFKGQSRAQRYQLALVLVVASVFGVAPGVAAEAGAVEVMGWAVPRFDQATPDMTLGDDPVNGRQMCPALTRLNLAAKKSEELLLRRVTEEFRDARKGSLWRLELRGGIYWWNGESVTSADVAEFVKRALPDIVAHRGAGVWKLPDFEVKADGPSDVVVRWETLPSFGPFVFNDAPFFRPVKSGPFKYECAGLYRPVPEGFGLTMKPAPGYKMSKSLPDVRLYRQGSKPPKSGDRQFELRFAGADTETNKASAEECKQVVELPFATMVLWNTEKGPTANRDFRHLMTQLVPRGVLATSGASGLAQVAAAPVPRVHPGFNAAVRVRNFDIRIVSEGLTRLGYRRKTAAAPRVDQHGKTLELLLLTQSNSPGLTEKVISDAYSAVGIRVRFKTELDRGEVADGVLAAFALDWPRVSFLGNLHSAASDREPFWSPKDARLDKLLEAYATSLTTAAPDFSLLGKIQAYLAEIEPMTVILQHKACVVASPGLKLAKGGLVQTDPDWFRQLLL